MAPAEQPRRRRWFWRILAVSVVVLAAAAAGLPWLASTGPARRWVLLAVNRSMAPTRIEAARIGLSWRGPLRLGGVTLRNGAGKVLVKASSATLDRGLWPIALGRVTRATLTLEGVAVDVARRRDGSIDLVEALAPVLNRGTTPAPATKAESKSGLDLIIVVVSGNLQLATPELAEPLRAGKFAATIHVPGALAPATWQAVLSDPVVGDAATLDTSGEVEHRSNVAGVSSMGVSVAANRWPLALATEGAIIRGRFDGKLDAKRREGFWSLTGEPSLLDVDATGPAFGGNRLQLDAVRLACDVVQTHSSWDPRRFELSSPVGSLRVAETVVNTSKGTPVPSTRIVGRLDLAALARQVPFLLRLREGLTLEEGTANFQAVVSKEVGNEGRRIALEASVSSLTARDRDHRIVVREPATLAAKIVQHDDNIVLERFALRSAGLVADGSGEVNRSVSLTAAIDLGALQARYGRLINFGTLEPSGHGRFVVDYRRTQGQTYVGRIAAEFHAVRIAGLTTDPIGRDEVRIDAAMSGPVEGSGYPMDWTRSRFGVRSKSFAAETKLSRRLQERLIRVDEVRVDWQPPTTGLPAQAKSGPTRSVHFVARGEFDPERGQLELQAFPDALADPFLLTGEGVKISGLNRPGPMRADVTLRGDLERLDRVLAYASGLSPLGLEGSATLRCELGVQENGTISGSGIVQTTDATLPGSTRAFRRPVAPLALQVRAMKPLGSNRLEIERLDMGCRYATIAAAGRVADPTGRRELEIRGTITPKWAAIDAVMARSVEPGAKVRGRPGAFKLHGSLQGTDLTQVVEGLDGELAIDGLEAVAFGMRAAPTRLVMRSHAGEVTISPIETTINGGRTRLKPGLKIDEAGVLTLLFSSGTSIEGAELNDEFSRRVLAYAAPVLDAATQIRGRVSVRVDHAAIPLWGGDARRHSALVARMDLDDVACTGGPLAAELYAMAGQRARSFRLRQSLELTVANGRVNQRGLSVPLGGDARMDVDGSVGFDQTLALRARLAADRGALGGDEGTVNELLEALQVGVPIGGTLARPTIDRRALRIGLRDLGKSLLKKGSQRDAAKMLERLVRPQDENAPTRR